MNERKAGSTLVIALSVLSLGIDLARPARADEIRLKDGEVIFGQVESKKKGRLTVRTADGVRRIPEGEIESRIEGEAPHLVLARSEADLAAGDAERRAWLAEFAWRHRLDAAALRLAREAVALAPDHEAARRLLGEHRVGGTWVAGWPPPGKRAGVIGPRWGQARRAALGSRGGTAASEKAVEAGLRWLAAHQDEDGKLDADGFSRHDPPDDRCDGQGGGHHGERAPCAFDGVTTSVALMAWLAAGSTPVSGPYRAPVKRALDWCVHRLAAGPGHCYGLWNHSFLTQGVADAYRVTRAPELRSTLDRAVRGMLAFQLPDGGFSYYMRIGDVPTTAAVATALGLAVQAGIVIDAERMKRVLGFLDARLDRRSGRTEYHDGAERKGYTPTRANAAAALTVRAFFGRLDEAPLLSRQVQAISDRKPKWKIAFKTVKTKDGREVRAQVGNLYPYQWYYTTLALSRHRDAVWSKWFRGLRGALLEGQRKDGAARGSWDPLGQYSSSAGRVFITGICVLMLEAPYRFPAP